MRDVIARIVDGSRFREFKKQYGPTIVTVCSYCVVVILILAHTPYNRASHMFMDMKLESLPIMASSSLLAL
jgi:hypothetical protein